MEAVSALLYDELVIQESRGSAPDAEAAAELLAQKALEAGIDRFVDQEVLNEFLARVEFAGFEPPDLPRFSRVVPGDSQLHRVEERGSEPRPYAGAEDSARTA